MKRSRVPVWPVVCLLGLAAVYMVLWSVLSETAMMWATVIPVMLGLAWFIGRGTRLRYGGVLPGSMYWWFREREERAKVAAGAKAEAMIQAQNTNPGRGEAGA